MTNETILHVIKLGSVRAVIFQSELENGRVIHSVTFNHATVTRRGALGETGFARSELPLITRAGEIALDWIYTQPFRREPAKADRQC